MLSRYIRKGITPALDIEALAASPSAGVRFSTKPHGTNFVVLPWASYGLLHARGGDGVGLTGGGVCTKVSPHD